MHASIDTTRQRTRVWRDAARLRPGEGAFPHQHHLSGRTNMIDQTTLKSIEDLHRLKTDGIITEDEFERSKQKLLFGGKQPAPTDGTTAVPSNPIARLFGPAPADLPADNDGIGWITLPLKRYATFTGRSTRKEFWMFQLLYLVIGFVGFAALRSAAGADGEPAGAGEGIFGLAMLALLGLVVPLIAVEARRFRDLDKSPWFVLLNLIPYVGVIIVYVAMLIPGTDGDNQFGPDPLAT